MYEERKQRLAEFTAWVKDYITGDEKGESQIFLDRLFVAFERKGIKEAGATLEYRVKKESHGGTAFADLVWKPVVLIEMKRRGEDLTKHYRQAFNYWTRLVPGRPRYVVLCNFDEFWVYDFETQMDSPVDTLQLADLPERWGPLAFLFPTAEKPVFGNDHQAVTRQAANRLAKCFNLIVKRKESPELAQRFILQTLVALFAENIGLLDQYRFTRLLEECKTPSDTFDLLGGLYEAMNTPGHMTGGRFKGVDYFNGGIFANPARIELLPDELSELRESARADWSKVRPEIFGVLFEHSMGTDARRAFGAHFTSPVDIMKIVGPTIVEPWREQIENATSLARMRELLTRMHDFTVLDPACGSGNFLYIAYREMKHLESRLLERIAQTSRRQDDPQQRMFGFVTTSNFFGLDINAFAVELAKVTMMLGRKLAIDELHITERALPLDNLDQNFIAGDALLDNAGNPRQWPDTDVIIGNPPFIGAKHLKPERGPDYVSHLRKAYPEIPGMADYCVYWLRKAHDNLKPCTAKDVLTGRAGLVGTQNIRNNQSRVGGLEYIVKTGTIIEAVDNQPWSGEANVHVSIVNWIKSQDESLVGKTRRLWSKADPTLPLFAGNSSASRKQTATPAKRKAIRKDKSFELVFRDCSYINSTLSDQTDVSEARPLSCNKTPQRVFQGQVPGHKAFVLSRHEATDLLHQSKENRKVIFPFLIGRDVVTGTGQPTRYVIDFQNIDVMAASAYKKPFERIQDKVLPVRQRKAEEGKMADGGLRPHHQLFLRYWWRHSYDRPEMVSLISSMPRYVVCSGVTKRPIFVFVDRRIRPDHSLFVFAFPDDYSFGILQGHLHWLWFTTKCSKLKSDFRYTPPSVYDTYPWPQSPSDAAIKEVAETAIRVRAVRGEALDKVKGGLRAIYRTLELPGKNPLKDAHAALDAAVLRAYGFSPKKDLLAQLLALNVEVAGQIANGDPVVSPGVPACCPDSSGLISVDCVRPHGK